MTARDRLLANIRKDETTGCWEWSASLGWGGYGAIKADGKTKAAHRVSFELHCGPIPSGVFVCHRCDNRICVNPEHLFLGTCQENVADMVAKGRHGRGSAHGRSKLTEQDIFSIRGAEGLTQRKLAAQYGVDQSMISYIRSGKYWAHLNAVTEGFSAQGVGKNPAANREIAGE